MRCVWECVSVCLSACFCLSVYLSVCVRACVGMCVCLCVRRGVRGCHSETAVSGDTTQLTAGCVTRFCLCCGHMRETRGWKEQREADKEWIERETRKREGWCQYACMCSTSVIMIRASESERGCVCLCVKEREGEKEREREKERRMVSVCMYV